MSRAEGARVTLLDVRPDLALSHDHEGRPDKRDDDQHDQAQN